MKKPLVFISIFVLLVTAACGFTGSFGFQTIHGSGNIVTESRQVSGFDSVEVCCGMELYLTQGGSESLEIEADDNFMDEIITIVQGDRLEIKYSQMNNVSYQPTKPVLLYLSMEDIHGVAISGGGYFEVDSIDSQSLDLSLSGGSDAWIAELISSRQYS